jgi:hypothetical protein
MEQAEGWFDDTGWSIDEFADQNQKWFPEASSPIVVGTARNWSLREWQQAARMWYNHGEEFAMSDDSLRPEYRQAAAERPAGNLDPTPEQQNDPAYRLWLLMSSASFYYEQNRSVTNFPYFAYSSQAEQKPETIAARKTLWLAEAARKRGDKTQAIRLYEKGLREWRDILRDNPKFHRPGRSDKIEEDTYAYELEYLRLIVQDDQRVREKARVLMEQSKAALQIAPFPIASASPLDLTIAQDEAKWVIAETDPTFSPFTGVIDIRDENNQPIQDPRNGQPWIRDDIKRTVRQQQGVERANSQQYDPMPAPTTPGVPTPPRNQ